MDFKVKVKPNSKVSKIVKKNDGELIIFAKNRPIKNRVNLEIIKILAKYFEISQSRIFIIKGLKSKEKVIKILD